MSKATSLSSLEQQTLMAIMRLHPNAYGVSIRDEIKKRTGVEFNFGSIYAVLERLEGQGMVTSREGEVTAARGGRRKSYFTITGIGQRALEASLHAIDAMRSGLKLKGAIA